MTKGKEYLELTPLVPIIKKDTPEAIKNTLLHWHLYKDDRFLAWEDGRFGRYYSSEDGQVKFNPDAYCEEELGDITTYLAEEENIIENEKNRNK